MLMHQEHEDDGLVGLLAPRLQQFAAVARSEHVTRASEALGVPQPTLSRSIARLEADLGVALFVRTGRRVRLTRAGALLLEHVERALHELEAGVRTAVGEASPEGGRVALGFLHTLGAVAVPRLLRAFRDQRPHVRFDLVQDSHDVLLARLREGRLDLVLTSPLPDDDDLETHALQEQELLLAVPPGHRLAACQRVRLAEAAAEQFVGMEPGYGLRRTTDAWCREAGFTPSLAFEGEEIDTLRGLVAAGLGVALLPPETPRGASGVVEVAVSAPRTTRTLGLVRVRRRPRTAPVGAFGAFVLDQGAELLATGTPDRAG